MVLVYLKRMQNSKRKKLRSQKTFLFVSGVTRFHLDTYGRSENFSNSNFEFLPFQALWATCTLCSPVLDLNGIFYKTRIWKNIFQLTKDENLPIYLVYNEAHEHHDNCNGNLQSLVREPKVYWKFERKLVDAVISFVMSPNITQVSNQYWHWFR